MTDAEAARRPRLSVPTYLLREQLQFAVLLWAGFTAFVLVLILAVAWWRGISISGWDQASQVVRWYALVIGGYVGWSVLALHVTHGQTRREFAGQAAVFVLVFATVLSGLVTLTFVLEAGLYRLAGWPQEIDPDRLYRSALEVDRVFLQSWLVLNLWTTGGLFIGAAWYREDGLGLLALGLAVVLAAVSGATLSGDLGPFGWLYERLGRLDAWVGIPIHLAATALLGLLAWLVIRDVAIRNPRP